MSMAALPARGELGSTPSNGGAAKWEIGSATPQNISTVLMPAANSMVNQARSEDSGSASSGPSLIEPVRRSTTHSKTQSSRDTVRM